MKLQTASPTRTRKKTAGLSLAPAPAPIPTSLEAMAALQVFKQYTIRQSEHEAELVDKWNRSKALLSVAREMIQQAWDDGDNSLTRLHPILITWLQQIDELLED